MKIQRSEPPKPPPPAPPTKAEAPKEAKEAKAAQPSTSVEPRSTTSSASGTSGAQTHTSPLTTLTSGEPKTTQNSMAAMHGLGSQLIQNFLVKPSSSGASSAGVSVTGTPPSVQYDASGQVIRDGSTASALGWAGSQAGVGRWDNHCLAFVSMSLNIPRDPNRHPEVYSAPNAITAYDNLAASGKMNQSQMTDPLPAGSAVFFEATDKNGQHGHVALATGRMAADGTPEVISSGWPGNSGVFTTSVGALAQDSGPYLGYANLTTDASPVSAPASASSSSTPSTSPTNSIPASLETQIQNLAPPLESLAPGQMVQASSVSIGRHAPFQFQPELPTTTSSFSQTLAQAATLLRPRPPSPALQAIMNSVVGSGTTPLPPQHHDPASVAPNPFPRPPSPLVQQFQQALSQFSSSSSTTLVGGQGAWSLPSSSASPSLAAQGAWGSSGQLQAALSAQGGGGVTLAKPPLARGSASKTEITALQNNLVSAGYLTQAQMNTGPGSFGPRTENAVKAFQQANGLPVSGVYDQTTATAMGQVLSGQPVTRPTPPTPSTSPNGQGLPTSVDQANQSFLSQWGPTAFNNPPGTNDIPYGYSDCGPTSALMGLQALGLAERPGAETSHLAIDAMRDAMFGSNTATSSRMGFATVKRGLAAYGAQGIDLPAGSTAQGIASINQALEQGMPVMLGTNNSWGAWGSQQRAEGNYLNSRNPQGHFVTILGRTPEGNYIVGDPLARNGAIEVSPTQMEKAIGGQAWGLVAIAPAS